MSKIWITSDQHFSHIQPFVWQARGYKSVEEMNEEQIRKWNAVVGKEDDVWFLGDGMMNDNVAGAMCFSQLNGNIHVVTGNHDSPARIEIYKRLGFDVQDGKRLSYKKKSFLLTHEPMATPNGAFKGWRDTINIHGHTHQTSNWTEGSLLNYHAGVDSHNGYPVLLDDIIAEIDAHWKKMEIGATKEDEDKIIEEIYEDLEMAGHDIFKRHAAQRDVARHLTYLGYRKD